MSSTYKVRKFHSKNNNPKTQFSKAYLCYSVIFPRVSQFIILTCSASKTIPNLVDIPCFRLNKLATELLQN